MSAGSSDSSSPDETDAHQSDSVAITTPIWRANPTDEEIAFLRLTDRSNSDVLRWFCAPKGLDVSFYERRFPEWRIQRFPDEVFESVTSYSRWLTEPDFYKTFHDVEFVTICQLDAVLVRDIRRLDLSGMDYLGSPWIPSIKVLTPGNRIYVASRQGGEQGMWVTKRFGRSLRVGNGGLSIRRIDAHIKATEWLTRNVQGRYRATTLEDVLLCAFAPRTGLRVAPFDVAERVFMETGSATLDDIPDIYGFHALWRWNPSLAESLTRRGH